MNIWSLQKDESIKLLLLLLHERLGPDNFTIQDSQQLDSRAIRLSKPHDHSISAYLFTYGQEDGKYGVHLELPDHAEMEISNTMEIYEDLTFERLAEMLSVHFDVIPELVNDGICYRKST